MIPGVRSQPSPTEPAAARIRKRLTAPAAWLLVGALPWTWFLVRDAGIGAVGEVISIVLPVLTVVIAAGAGVITYRRRRSTALVLAVSTLAAGVVATVGPWLPADAGTIAGRGISVIAANIDGRDTAALDTLRALDADVLVVPEVSLDLSRELAATYAHHYVRIHDNDDPDIAVFSRYPMKVLQPVGPDMPGARLEVAGPDGRFVLYGLHVPRPWFAGESDSRYQATIAEHRRLEKLLNQQVRTETLPVVLAGDLNSTDRERDYREWLRAGLVDAMRDTAAGPTSTGKWLPLLGRIDHILINDRWCGDTARRVALPRSSHLAVAVTAGPCA